MELRDVVIVDACRTAVGKFGGTLKPVKAHELATVVIKGILERNNLDPAKVSEVIMGQCRQSSDESNVARVAALEAGIPDSVPAYTVMRACASAMTAMQNGAYAIMAGTSDIVIAGGTESMSNGIHYLSNARWGVGTGNVNLVDALTEAQLTSQPQDVYGSFSMGATAENIALTLGITREKQDAFSLDSQRKAIAAVDSGRFRDEIVPVVVPQGKKKDPIVFVDDEFPNRATNEEKMAKLKPCFNIRKDDNGRVFPSKELTGTVTAGSSSGRNDGASAVLLMSEEKAKELGLKPIARLRGFGNGGVDPRLMGLGPVVAAPKALENAGLTIDDMGLIELNEAFASQSLGCIKQLGWEDKMDIINVNGGAIALGHPIGSSGCRIVVTLVHEMKKRGVKYGLATLCIAGGMGQACVVELCD